MLNSFREYQRVLVLGGDSEIALGTLKYLEVSSDSHLILVCRKRLDIPNFLVAKYSSIESHDIDLLDSKNRTTLLSNIFESGDIDLVIIAFGVFMAPDSAFELSELERMFETNFSATSTILFQVTRNFMTQNHGQVVVFSSVAALRPRLSNFAYGATKAGIDFISRGLQLLIKDTGVHLTIIRPGFVKTKMTAGYRVAPFAIEADAAGKLCAWALQNQKSLVYAPRYLWLVAIFLRIIPNFVINFLEKK